MEPGHRRHEKQGREEPAQSITAQMTFLHVQREGVNGTLIAVVQRSESNLISSCELPKQLLVILREIRMVLPGASSLAPTFHCSNLRISSTNFAVAFGQNLLLFRRHNASMVTRR